MLKHSGKKSITNNQGSTPVLQQIHQTVVTEKNPAAVALGRMGGLKGGIARANKLTKKQLSEIGKKGAQKRWMSKKKLK